MLTPDMKHLISHYRAGMVATIKSDGNDAGSPAVSPKATFVIIDDKTLAYGDIRSPGTRTNLSKNPAVEVCFIDVLARKAVRVSGTAEIIAKAQADAKLKRVFETDWAEYLPHMSRFVVIHLSKAEMILSPAYEHGYTQEQLVKSNLAKLTALHE